MGSSSVEVHTRIHVDCDTQSPSPTGNGDHSGFASYAADLGDDVATVFTVSHSLDSTDVLTSVRSLVTGVVDEGSPVVAVLGPDQVSVTFSTPPSMNSYRLLVVSVK